MLQSDEEISALIDKIYDAALAPQKWGSVIEDIGRQIGATSGTSLWFSQSGLELIRADIWNVAEEALLDYQLHYLPFCPRYRASRELKAGSIYNDEMQRQSVSNLSREYYNFVDRHEIGRAAIALVEKREELTIGVNFYCGEKRQFDPQAESVLSALMPHLRRATNVTSKYIDVIERADLADAFFHARQATVTLDRSGRAIRMNLAAEDLLSKKDGVSLLNGYLSAATTVDDAALQEQIGLAVQPGDTLRCKMVRQILISRPSGRTPISAEVIRLQRGHLFAREVALVSLSEAPDSLRLAYLQTAFRLTNSEIDVVSLLHKGLKPEQIADSRTTSVQTVRSQIKSIYSKMGVRSQIELLSKIAIG